MLKVLWWSTIPYANAGYGIATREILKRFKQEGHSVVVGTKHVVGGQIEVDGITCFDGTQMGLVNVIQQEDNYDYIISMADDWTIPQDFRFNKWINICFCDTHEMHPRLVNASKKALHTIAATKFTQEALRKAGVNSLYAPLGVDTSIFKPSLEKRKRFRDSKGFKEDQFVIGSVGINYSSDRKNFIGLIRAFAAFHKRHPDSVLYLHTDVMGTATSGLPLTWVMKSMGFPDNDTGPIRYVSQKDYHRWSMSQEGVVQTYNGFDVFCFPTNGEGFGMPIIEAQACGIPTITVNTTSGKELLKGGWLIDVNEDNMEFSTHLCWFARVVPTQIDEALEKAYVAWKNGEAQEIGLKAREGVICYDWDIIYRDYWSPIFKLLDEEKQGKKIAIFDYPDWQKLYDGFGQVYSITNCEEFAHDGERACDEMVKILPRLLGEPEEDPRPVLIRSYPIFPNIDGELYVHTKCAAHKFLPPRFINKCKEKYKEVLAYPKVRKSLEKAFKEFVENNPEYIKISDIVQEFDASYKKQLQTTLRTKFYFTPEIKEFLVGCESFLDVGCGDGRFVKDLNNAGKKAHGIEINPEWIDNKDVTFGSIMNIPYEDSSFDCVVCIDVLEHLTSPLDALKELLRVTKNKVVLQVTSTNNLCYEEDPTHIVEWSFNQWVREINELGKPVFVMPQGKDMIEVIIIEKKHE